MAKKILKNKIRCPRLGDEVTLEYCVREAGDLPCSRMMQCWSPFFDIETFLKKNLAPEQWAAFVSYQPKEKITSLIELIEAAKTKK
jgi:hypothetical protein